MHNPVLSMGAFMIVVFKTPCKEALLLIIVAWQQVCVCGRTWACDSEYLPLVRLNIQVRTRLQALYDW